MHIIGHWTSTKISSMKKTAQHIVEGYLAMHVFVELIDIDRDICMFTVHQVQMWGLNSVEEL
jgi:hypothetical protein